MGLGRFITHTMFGRGAADYGAVPAPGSKQFALPADKVYLTSQEAKKRTYTVTGGPEFPDAVEPQILLGS